MNKINTNFHILQKYVSICKKKDEDSAQHLHVLVHGYY